MRLMMLTGIVLLAVLSRLIPHPINFSPVMAIALFAGAHFTNKKLAYLLPMGIMLVADLFLGFHSSMFAVYGSFALMVAIGSMFMKKTTTANVLGGSIAGAVLFFVITNLSVWAFSGMYSLDMNGFILCYEMALPFFRNTLASSVLYSALLFGSYALAEKFVPALQPVK